MSKEEFLKGEFLYLSINGAFQHNSIYKIKDGPERSKFKNKVREILNDLSKEYKNKVDEKEHIDNILKLQSFFKENDEICKECSFGIAQKLLNLYLKYLWTAGYIEEPPHCPIDRMIISKAKIKINWSEMTQAEYQETITKLKEISKDNSIAKWELEYWSRKSDNGSGE